MIREKEEIKDYAINYVKNNLERKKEGLEIQQPADNERFEIMAFVQYMLKILTDLNDINMSLNEFEQSEYIRDNIEAYQKLLKSLYSEKTGA